MTRRARTAGQPIDWQAVRQRIQLQHRAAGPPAMSDEQSRALLDERARALARPHADAASGDARIDVLAFEIGADRFAIETKYVREVIRLVNLTPVRGVPDFFAGLTNYRGEILCVVDLRRLIGAPAVGLSDLSRLVIVGIEAAEFALLADRVDRAPSLAGSELLSAESAAAAAREFVMGVTPEALVVLDGRRLLDDPRLVIDDRGPVGK